MRRRGADTGGGMLAVAVDRPKQRFAAPLDSTGRLGGGGVME